MKKVFTTGQVAKICKVAPRTVSKWFDSGRLRGYRIPGSDDRRIPREHLIRFLKEHGMPLGELESEELCKVSLVGLDALMTIRLKALLPEEEGFVVSTLLDPFEAGMHVEAESPDIVVIDHAIGRSTALSMVAQMRGNTAHENRCLIGLANEDEPETLEALQKRGYDDVFRKQFDIVLLAEATQRMFEEKRRDEDERARKKTRVS